MAPVSSAPYTPLAVLIPGSPAGIRRALLLSILIGGLAPVRAGADDDVVVMRNGDALTGEVKSLDRGMLRFDTDAIDTIDVQWSLVAALASSQNFQITLDDDRQIFGSLGDSDTDGVLLIVSPEGPLNLPIGSIVRMDPIEGRLIDRVDMSVNLGYNFTKADNLNQTTFGYDFSYRSEERLMSVDSDASRSSSSEQPKSIRTNSSLSYRRFREDRSWDPVGFGVIERNDELGLDRRVTGGGGMSRWLTDRNTNRISIMGGLVGTRENEADAAESDTSLEAAAGFELDWFRHDDPELDVTLNFSIYERLSGDSRTRGTLDVDLRWELVNDFFWGFTSYYTFNSRPTGDAEREDYGILTTIGWSF